MWNAIKTFFKDSETIFWARVQTLLGLIAGVLTYVDPALVEPVLGDSWKFAVFLLANGIATEYLRRRRDENM